MMNSLLSTATTGICLSLALDLDDLLEMLSQLSYLIGAPSATHPLCRIAAVLLLVRILTRALSHESTSVIINLIYIIIIISNERPLLAPDQAVIPCKERQRPPSGVHSQICQNTKQ